MFNPITLRKSLLFDSDYRGAYYCNNSIRMRSFQYVNQEHTYV